MTHKKLLITAALTALLFSGCSQKAPELENAQSGKNNVSDATQIAGETVSIDENAYGNKDGANGTNSTTTGKYNSSSDGLQSIYFGFGDYGISSAMENNIATNSSVVSNATGRIKIEGNCDEFGTDEYNYALGLKRAKSVKDSLVAQGIASNKMVIISYGESNPVCSNPTDGCYSQNRRVDLRIVK
jgi:peptidoglycan-associated lipoprotein